jgi:hypothetical protein
VVGAAKPAIILRMDDTDRDALRFAAAHSLIASDQVAVLTGDATKSDSIERVHRLVGEGLLSRTRIAATVPDCLVVTEAGLEAIGSRLRVPAWEMRGLRGVRAAGWVWVRAQDGRIPGLTGVWSEREMVGHDLELSTAGPVSGGGAAVWAAGRGHVVGDRDGVAVSGRVVDVPAELGECSCRAGRCRAGGPSGVADRVWP